MVTKSKLLSAILVLIISLGFTATLPASALAKGKPAEDWGAKQLCSTLGGKEKHFRLDIDPYTFEGQKGEKVIITLSADPSGSQTGDRATLILTSRFKCFFKIDRGPLPNKISTVLPAQGEYFVYVIEQFKNRHFRSFRGSYCLSLESSQGAWASFRPFQPPYWHKHPITWIPENIEETVSKGTSKKLDVAFISRIDLKKARLWVTPELKPFIRIEPDHFKRIEDNVPNQVVLHLTVPADAKPGHYDGTIHLRVGHRTYPETLKVDLHVIENAPPVANAGPDQVIALPEAQTTVDVQLDGSSSHDPDGSIASHAWTGTPDPEDVVKPTVKLKQGIYDFTLQVTDNDGATSTVDNVKVTIVGPPLLMPLPEVVAEASITLKGVGLPGATILISNAGTGESKEILNEKGYFEVPLDLAQGMNEIRATAKLGDIESTPSTLKTVYKSDRLLQIDTITPEQGQAGSIITITGSRFTSDPNVMGVYFKGPELEGTGLRLEGKGVVLEATETSLRVIVPFIFLKSDSEVDVYVYDGNQMSNSLPFQITPASDPTPDIKGNEVDYQLDLVLDQLYGILTKIERFTRPRMPSQQWSIVEENFRRMINAIEILKSKLNSIPDDNNVKSNLDSIFSSGIFILINEKLEEINEILSHSTEGESYCNLARVIRILNEIIEPIRAINRLLDIAIGFAYPVLVGNSIACFFGCIPCCTFIPVLAEVISTLSAIDGVFDAILGIFDNVIRFLQATVPMDMSNWKTIISGPFKGIDPHILYTNTHNKLTVYADFASKPFTNLLGQLINIDIAIPDPYGICRLVESIANINPCVLIGDLLGEGVVQFVLDILPIDELTRITATDLPVQSKITSLYNNNILSFLGYEELEHTISTNSKTGQALIEIQATCGEYSHQQNFLIEVIQNPTLYGTLEWQADQYCYDTVVHTCYENGRYFCTRGDYREYLSRLCEGVSPGYPGNSYCSQYEACYFYDSESNQYIETCEIEDYQSLLDSLCGIAGNNCEELINEEIRVCLDYGHWVFGGKGFGVPLSAYCYPIIVKSCYYQGRYLCDLDEYRSYLRRLCQNQPPNNQTCAQVELCYDPGERIYLCTLSEYERLLEELCGGPECNIISEETTVCDPGGNFFEVYWNGEPINIGSPSFDTFYIYSSPYLGYMKPGRLSVSIESAGDIRESSTIFVPPSPNLNAQFDIINPLLYPGDILYIKGNYFTPYEEDMELMFTDGNDALSSVHPSEMLVKGYDSRDDFLLSTMPPLIDNGGETIDVTVKAGPSLPCQSNNCSSGEITLLPYESGGTTLEDDQDLMIWGEPYGYIRSAAVGDLNGDGINDLVVGVPSGGRNFGIAFGAVYVKFGEINGTDFHFGNIKKQIIDIGTNWDVKIVGDTEDVASGGNTRRIGNSLSIADLNGDGISDLLIGTTDRDENDDHRVDFGNTVSPAHLPGKAYVIYGKPDWQREYFLSNENDYDVKFFGNDSRELGYQVGAGRIYYGHDYKDLVITAPTDALNQLTSRAYVLSGWNGSLPKKNIKLPDDLSIFDNFAVLESSNLQQIDNITNSQYIGDGMGKSLAIGDIDGDGLDEIVLGAPQYSQTWSSNPWTGLQGAGYIFGGRMYDSKPLQGWYFADAMVESSDYTAIWGARIQYANELTEFGKTVHVVDLNNDGKSEIIIGAPSTPRLEDRVGDFMMPNEMQVGRMYVIDGENPALYEPILTADYEADLIINGSTSISRFGYSLASGDINYDGIKDLLVGAPGRGERPGRVWVMFGSNIPLWKNTSGQDLVSLQTRKRIHGDLGEYRDIGYQLDIGYGLENGFDYVITGSQYKGINVPQFGAFVITGDLNPYVGDDVLIIDPTADSPNGQLSGMLYVFYEGSQELWPLTIHPETVNMYFCDSEQTFTISGGLKPHQFQWGKCYQTYIGQPPIQIPGPVICYEDQSLPDNFEVTYGEDSVFLKINGCIPNDLKSLWLTVTDSPLHNVSVTREINFLKQDIAVSPLNINFGDVEVGWTVNTPITVSNSGNYELQIYNISLTGSPDIRQTNDCPPILVPNSSCTINTIFNPLTEGAATATLTVTSNDPDEETININLTGNGIGEPDIKSMVVFGSLDFQDVPVGNSQSVRINIWNEGSAYLNISNVSISGAAEFSLTENTCSGALDPPPLPGSCYLIVTFTPTGTDVVFGNVTVESNDPDTPTLTWDLSGNGVLPALSVSPIMIDMGYTSMQASFLVINNISGCVTPLGWEITGTLPSWLSVSPMSGVIDTCGGTSTLTVEVDRSGLPAGQYSHTIPITSNSGSGSVTVIMDVPGFISVTPASVDFAEAKKMLPLRIQNRSSTSSLTWNITNDLPGWLTASQMSGEILPGGSVTIYLFANRSGLYFDQTYTHTVSITSNGGNATIPISMTVPVPLATFTKYYGGDDNEFSHVIRQTSDGGFVAAGMTDTFGAGNQDSWAVKLDASGFVEWEKTYGGSNDERADDIRETSDGGYIMVGRTYSYSRDNKFSLWILKLDSYGDIRWEKEYGGNVYESMSWGPEFSIQETPDGGYIVAGSTFTAGFRSDFWVIKLNQNGEIEWQKRYGGTDDDFANSIQQTSDGGYIVSGVTESYGAGDEDIWVLKLDPSGVIQWQKTYGGTSYDYGYEIRQTSDGGYILAGLTGSFGGAWVIKLDSDGNIDWQKTYGAWDGYGYSIKQTEDGGYILAGSFYRSGRGSDAWLLKLDSSGNIEWQKAYGGNRIDEALSVQQTAEGDYIVAGYTNSFRVDQYGRGNNDAWVLKTDSIGNIGASCGIIDWPEATYVDTVITAVETSVIPQDTSATPQDTRATVTDSNAVTDALCSETIPEAGQRPLIDIDVSPLSYDFGNVPIGQFLSQNFIVRNVGYTPISINNITLSVPADFQMTHNCPSVLDIVQQCGITVTFTPYTEGLHRAYLRIESSDPDEGLIEINITGTGWTPEGGGEEPGGGGEGPGGGLIPIGGG